jgi:hypothetical protein
MELRFTGVGLNTAHGSATDHSPCRGERETRDGSEPEAHARREAPDEFCDNSEGERDDGETEQVIGTRRNMGGSMVERIVTGMGLRDRSAREQRNQRGEAVHRVA